MKHIITLCTDFGIEDPYAGVMKGVILGINPEARIVDITHSIPKFEVLTGALTLSSYYCYYPQGTIHIAVIDPGVGSDRKPIAMEADGNYFVGPDNGLFSLIYKRSKTCIREITNPEYMRPQVSSTFHGRDIFAPAAAHISLGASINELGDEVLSPVTIELPEPEILRDRVSGEIIHTDSFGNLLTNIPGEMVKRGSQVFVGELSLGAPKSSYRSAKKGELLAIIGSSGYLEISLNRGSAYEALGRDLVVTVVTE